MRSNQLKFGEIAADFFFVYMCSLSLFFTVTKEEFTLNSAKGKFSKTTWISRKAVTLQFIQYSVMLLYL